MKIDPKQNFEIFFFSDLKQSRLRILELLPDPHHDAPKMETAIKLYFGLLRGFMEFTTSEGSTSASKLRHSVRFRWTQSLLGMYYNSLFRNKMFMLDEITSLKCSGKKSFRHSTLNILLENAIYISVVVYFLGHRIRVLCPTQILQQKLMVSVRLWLRLTKSRIF